MNDDVSNRTFNLAVSTTKLSARTLLKAVIKINNKWNELQKQPKKGKQSVGDLLSHNQGLTSVDVAETDLKGFKKVARKYNIDYAIKKDKYADPPRYIMFLKSADNDTMLTALKEYANMQKFKEKRKESVLGKLKSLSEITKSIPKKIKNKTIGEPSL